MRYNYLSLTVVWIFCSVASLAAKTIVGTIQLMGQPIKNAQISLWQTSSQNPAKKILQVESNRQGFFSINYRENTKSVFYLVSHGGMVNSSSNLDKLKLFTILDESVNNKVSINELTTVGSVWPNAQLLEGDALNGSANGLAIGSGHVHHLVNVVTGSYGDTLLNGDNLPNSETMARLNTIASLVALCGQSKNTRACEQLLQLTDAKNTLEALVNLAKQSWQNTKGLYQLFTDQYAIPAGKTIRAGAKQPYLLFEPADFSLSIHLQGGGAFALGKLLFDKQGNLWTGSNWMPGSQSGVVNSIGGGLAKFNTRGQAVSPAPQGFNQQGLNGAGWGTGISNDKVWFGSFNKKIGVFDLQGKPLGPVTFNGKIGQPQGIATAPNGDVWIADNTEDQMILFPNGNEKKGKLIKIKGLIAPFGVAVDKQNRVWVTSSEDNKLTIFPGQNPKQSVQIKLALGARGIAIDANGYAWVSQQTDKSTLSLPPGQKPPPRPTSIMQEFEEGLKEMLKDPNGESGMLALISPDLKVIKNQIGKGIFYIPWGVSIDGNNTVWVASLYNKKLVHLCGTYPSYCPLGTNTGDIIHIYSSGVIQRPTDVIVDDAGNIWNANNWNDPNALINHQSLGRISTFGGGQGIVVTYGVASPVNNPLIGPVKF